MGDGTDVPPIGLLSNIPESPMAQSHLATAEILEADRYDSDKEVNNNNPIINEESLEEEEEELPEVGENLDAAEGEGMATNVGTFVDIPQEAMKKMKVVELKAELTKRGKSTTGLKAVLLERLKDVIANGVVIVANTPGATTTPPDDLRGFAEKLAGNPLFQWKQLWRNPQIEYQRCMLQLYHQAMRPSSHKSMILLRNLIVYHLLGRKRSPNSIAMAALS